MIAYLGVATSRWPIAGIRRKYSICEPGLTIDILSSGRAAAVSIIVNITRVAAVSIIVNITERPASASRRP